MGNFDDIEIDGKQLICRRAANKSRQDDDGKAVVQILAEEMGYNVASKEYRTILVSRPLVVRGPASSEGQTRAMVSIRTILAPLSPRSQKLAQSARKQRAQLISSRTLIHHDDCAGYLESISQQLTVALENELKRMQTNYIILSPYLEDAASRSRTIADDYIRKYEQALEQSHSSFQRLCDTIKRSIRISVENHVVHLLHGKLLAAVHECYEKEDATLEAKFGTILSSKLSLCELGAQADFSEFILADEPASLLKRLPNLQSPIAMVSCLMKLVDLISDALNQSVTLKRLSGDNRSETGGQALSSSAWKPTPICSDDLIATFVFCIPRAGPNNLFSLIRYLEMFGWSSAEKDQVSYYLTTLESAVEYIMNLSDQRGPHEHHREGDRMASDAVMMDRARPGGDRQHW